MLAQLFCACLPETTVTACAWQGQNRAPGEVGSGMGGWIISPRDNLFVSVSLTTVQACLLY